MAIGTLAWNLYMPHGQETAGLVATRKELRAAAVTREMSQPTEMYGTALDNLNQLLNKDLISVENYRRKLGELQTELREFDQDVDDVADQLWKSHGVDTSPSSSIGSAKD